MPEQQKLYIIRKEYDGFGGAENVAKRYATLLSEHYEVELIYAGYKKDGYTFHGKYGPGWYRSLLFAISVSQFLKSQPDSLVFSMARGVVGSIFRAGDGVHKIWLKRKKTYCKSALFLEIDIWGNHLCLSLRKRIFGHWPIPANREQAETTFSFWQEKQI